MASIVTKELSSEEGFRAVLALRALADDLEREHVQRALASGWSWRRIAEALNVTRQAVHKKYGPRARVPTPQPRRS